MDLALAAIASFAVLAAVFVPLERLFAARRQPVLRSEWMLDLAFFVGQYFVFAGLATLLLASLQHPIEAASPVALRSAVADLPFALQAVVAIVAGDFLVYWFHRACHRFDWLWRFHAAHHSSTHLDWLAAHREHPLDGIGTQFFMNLPVFVLDVPVEILGGAMVFRSFWAIFVHSNVRVPLGPLRLLLGAPELHHWHHARVERTTHNFANLAPWLDWMFGTHHRPHEHATYELGTTDTPRRSYLEWLLQPLVPARRDRKRNSALGPSMPSSNR